jgi:hypothetical protein
MISFKNIFSLRFILERQGTKLKLFSFCSQSQKRVLCGTAMCNFSTEVSNRSVRSTSICFFLARKLHRQVIHQCRRSGNCCSAAIAASDALSDACTVIRQSHDFALQLTSDADAMFKKMKRQGWIWTTIRDLLEVVIVRICAQLCPSWFTTMHQRNEGDLRTYRNAHENIRYVDIRLDAIEAMARDPIINGLPCRERASFAMWLGEEIKSLHIERRRYEDDCKQALLSIVNRA